MFKRGDGLGGIDLDDVIEPGGRVLDWARAVLRKAPSYTEVSPSGRGLHIIMRTDDLPQGVKVTKVAGSVEAYTWGRFFCFTGRVFEDRRELAAVGLPALAQERLFAPQASDLPGKVAAQPRHQEAALDIIVSVDRGIPAHALMLLKENHPDFWRFWCKAASPTRDATHSGYMASVARRLADLGKGDQFIADALVTYCHMHGRQDKIDRRQIERCMMLARNEAFDAGIKPEALEEHLKDAEQDEVIAGAEDQKAEALKILSSHFRMQVSDVRRFGRFPGRVQLANCEEWLDVGTPAEVLRQLPVLEAIYHCKAIAVPRVKPERWLRIATLIGQNWRIEEPGDEDDAQRLESLIEACFSGADGSGVRPKDQDGAFAARARKTPHEWSGEQVVFSVSLANSARQSGINGLYRLLHEIGFRPGHAKLKNGKTARCWSRTIAP